MIDEAIGKILGMAMAYGVSSLGMLLAYVNYRKRIVKAEKVISGRAWAVIAATLLSIAGGVFVVAQLAQPQPVADAAVAEAVAEETAPSVSPSVEASSSEEASPGPAEEGSDWPMIGIILPAVIFLSATWLTMSLHRHFSRGADA